MVFLNNTNGNKTVILNAHEGAWKMSLPLFLLSFFSIFIGFLTKDLFIGFGTDFWNDSIYILPENYILCDIEFMHISYKLLPLIFTMFGIIGAIFLYGFNLEYYLKLKKNSSFKSFYNFFNKKWYFDRFYNQIVSQNFLSYSYYFSYKDIDRGFLEIFGPFKLTKTIEQFIFLIKSFQSGNIFHYLFIFLIFILLTIFVCLVFV